ncbi:MAG: LamG-like jellyroll fold domain-containing protein [Candidatus Diapherotrites archaeon]|nr:LamG-like jellyroll fold domain-containing protein [Candidatus Diapherotrites archaeon]
MRAKLLLVCFVLLLFASFAFSATYYVSTAGVDSNPGSQASPFRTIQKCASVAVAGDTCLILPGTYRESVTLPRSGTAGNPITFQSTVPKQAIIDGSEQLTGFTQCESQSACGNNPNWASIYYADLPAGVTPFTANIIENEEFLWIAQEPDQPDPLFFDNYNNFFVPDSMSTTSIVDSDVFNQADPNYWSGSSVLLYTSPNVVVTRAITQYVPGENRIYYNSINDPSTYNKYSIYNSMPALDKPGEYYVNPSGRAFVWPRVSTSNITVSVRKFGINTGNNDYLVIDGFKIQKVTGDQLRDGIAIGTFNPAGSSSNITIENNEISHNRHVDRGYGGIYLTPCLNCLIANNYFYENFAQIGIFTPGTESIQSSNVVLNNNTFIRQGQIPIWFMRVSDSVISNNYIKDSRGTHSNAITVYMYSRNIQVVNNQVYSSNFSLAYNDDTNIVITGNIFRNGVDGAVRVIANGANMNGIYISHNTLIGTIDQPVNSTSGHVVKDNILGGFCPAADSIVSNNIYHNLMWCQNGVVGPTEAIANLRDIFVNPDSDDYRLIGNNVGNPPKNPCSMSSTGSYIGAIPCVATGDITPPVTIASLVGGVYTSVKSVSLSRNESGTTYYCLGSGCSPATNYSSPILISTSNVLRFYSVDLNNNVETMKQEAYVINIDSQSPSVPSSLSATVVSSSQINLSWTASTDNVGVSGYNVLRSLTQAGAYVQVGFSASNSHSDSNGLSASTTYYYKVSAFDAANNESSQSSIVSATTLVYQAPQGLILWIKADDSVSDGIATDSGGNGLNSMCSGSDCPVYSAGGGKFGGAYQFNGSVGKLTLPLSPLLRLSSQTKAAWVNLVQHKNYNILFGDEAGDYFGLRSNGTQWRAGYTNGSGVAVYGDLAGSQIPLNSWHHVAFVYAVSGNNVNIKYYLDGVLQSQINGSSGFTLKALLRIANSSPYTGSPLNGLVDDVRVYDSALSQQEIQAMMAGDFPPPQTCFDLTSDSKVDLFDLVFVALRIGNATGDPADVKDNDGVNISDLQEVAKQFGQTC